MKHVKFNDDGLPAAYFISGLHNIPSGAVEISDDLHRRMTNEKDGVWKRDAATGEIAKHRHSPPTVAYLIDAKLSDVNAACELAICMISEGYPPSEVSSWPKQENEARKHQADAAAAVPLLSALATARGVPLPELVGRVVAKADAFAVYSGQVIGKRQGLEDQLDALRNDPDATPADVEAVKW